MKINYLLVTLLLFTFFTISFITNLLAPLFPALIESYDIGLALAGFFAFAFFIAYGVMSIPAGLLVQQFGEKKIMQLAFLLALIGSVIFVTMPTFFVAMLALFLIGCAMAMLQVAINPLLRASGGAHNFAVLSVAAQLMFGLAASISPLVYSHISGSANRGEKSWLLQWVPENMSWLSMYLIFALVCAVMLVAVSLVPMAKKADDNSETLHLKDSLALLKDRTVIKFFFAIAAYVAIEQGVANSISVFLERYHQIDPQTQGAQVVSHFWLALTLGCLLGIVLLKLFNAKRVLQGFSVAASACFIAAIFGSKEVAVMAFPAVGFFLSIMWSVIFSLALNSVSYGHGAVSGVLCTGIIGGALASPTIGLISDLTNSLQLALLVVLIPLVYLFSVGIWAKPLVNNHTINIFKRNAQTSI